MQPRSSRGLEWFWSVSGLTLQAALLVGLYAGIAGWKPSAWVMIGALGGLVGSHIAISVVAYRRTMRRPWPKVAPLPADDD